MGIPMLSEILLASAFVGAGDALNVADLDSVNAYNDVAAQNGGQMVCVNPIPQQLLTVDPREQEDVETPIGRVSRLAEDVSFIRNRIENNAGTSDVVGRSIGQKIAGDVVNEKAKSSTCFLVLIAAIVGAVGTLFMSKIIVFVKWISCVAKAMQEAVKQQNKDN